MGSLFSIFMFALAALAFPNEFQPILKTPPRRGLEIKVLRAHTALVKMGADGVETLLPSLDLGFRFQRGLSIHPRAVVALIPGPGGVEIPVSMEHSRFEGTWVISSLPRDISIRLVDKNGQVVERLEFSLQPVAHAVHVSEACKAAGLELDLQGHTPPGTLMLLCSPASSTATVLALGAQSLALSPALENDRILGTQAATLDVDRDNTSIRVGFGSQEQEYRVVTRRGAARPLIVKNLSFEGRLGAISLSANQIDRSAGAGDSGAVRNYSGLAPWVAGSLAYHEDGGVVEMRIDTGISPASLSSKPGHAALYRLTPGILLWPLRKSHHWSLGVGVGVKQEWHLIKSWSHRDVTITLQPELFFKVRRHFIASTSALTYSAGFAPSRFPGANGFGDRYILVHELAYTHRGESGLLWGFWLSHTLFRHLQDQIATRSESASAGLSLGW